MSYPHSDEDHESSSVSRSENIWMRGLVMLVFMACFGVAQSLLFFLAVVQFIWMLIKSERNGFLAQFGHSLGAWLAETAQFLSGDTDEKPFPWRSWPEA